METKPIDVLLIGDNPEPFRLFREMLEEAGGARFHLKHAERLSPGLERLATNNHPAVALLDLDLPDSQGYETFLRLKNLAPDLPIVVLMGSDDQALAMKAMSEGAQDYLVKGQVTGELLVRSLRYSLERKRAQVALRESEARFQALFDKAPLGFQSLDEAGRVLIVNQTWLDILGYRREEVIGQWFGDFLTAENTARFIDNFSAFKASGEMSGVEFNLVRKDGAVITVFFSGKVEYDSRGKFFRTYCFLTDVKAREQADEALRKSEERYRTIVETAQEGIWVLDGEARTAYANQRLGDMLGYTVPEMLGRHLFDFLDEEGILNARWNPAKRPREVGGTYEFAFRRKDGAIVWTMVAASPLLDAGGKYLGALGMITDITQRRQAEEALKKSEAEKALILDSMSELVAYLDTDLKIIWANRAKCAAFGAAPEDLKGRHCYEVLWHEKQPCPDCPVEKTLRTGQFQEAERELPDGRCWLIRGYPVRHESGDLMGVIEVTQDITHRKEAEEAFHNLVNSAPIGIYILQKGKAKLINPGFGKITGYSAEELTGMECLYLVAPDFKTYVKHSAVKMLKGESSAPYEYQFIHKNGEPRWVMESVTSTQYQGKRATLGYFMDITERKELAGQFLQAQKMEAVGRLASGVAHDFNNILMAIMGYCEIIARDLRKDNPLNSYVEEITKAADRAATLTRQLLAFSRKQILQPRIINLNEIVTGIEAMLRRLIGEDIDLVINLEPQLGAVKADPGKIEQVIMNLAVNARDALPQGGKLCFETANVHLDSIYAHRHVKVVPGPYVLLAASDTGVGMDAETRTQIFEPFFTTKDPGKGTGLGLSTVYGIVKQSQGYIEVYSEPGHGTTFKIYLPRVEEAVIPQPAAPSRPLRGTETILVVEDEDMLRELVMDILEMYGYKVIAARHGAEAQLICEQHPGPIHLMVTDVVMPLMSGRQLAQHLSELNPQMKVLYMSGYMEDSGILLGIIDGNAPFIQKPFGPVPLAQKVREVLDAPAP